MGYGRISLILWKKKRVQYIQLRIVIQYSEHVYTFVGKYQIQPNIRLRKLCQIYFRIINLDTYICIVIELKGYERSELHNYY